MGASTGTPSTVVLPQGQNKSKMSRLGTKLRKKLSATGRQKKPTTEQNGRKFFSIGLVFTKGSIPKIECHQGAEEKGKAPEQQRAAVSEPRNSPQDSQSSTTEGTQETASSTQTSTSETSSTSMSSGEKAYRDFMIKKESRARKKQTQLRLGRRVARWCHGGPLPPLEDFNEMSPTQISDYLRLQNVSEEWIQAVVSQIAFVRESKEIPEEVQVNSPPSKWPWDENYTIAMTLHQCVEDRMSYAQIGYLFYQLVYRQDDPIDNVVTKAKESEYSFKDMGLAMMNIFSTASPDDKGRVITESKPYYGPDAVEEEEYEEYEEPPQPEPQRRQRDEGKQREGEEQRHQKQLNIQDWYHRPYRLDEESADERRSIKPAPGCPLPEGYKMINGRAYRIMEAGFRVPLLDDPPANMPTTVRRRGVRHVQPQEDQKAKTKSDLKRLATPKPKASKQDPQTFFGGEDERRGGPQSTFGSALNYSSCPQFAPMLEASRMAGEVVYMPASAFQLD